MQLLRDSLVGFFVGLCAQTTRGSSRLAVLAYLSRWLFGEADANAPVAVWLYHSSVCGTAGTAVL
jgi:hypothetical protein